MRLIAVLTAFAVSGCALETAPAVSEGDAVRARPASSIRPLAAYPSGFEMDGIAADDRYVFTCVPTSAVGQDRGVLVASRESGLPVGQLPPPPNGWSAPTGVEALGRGELLVFDNGALPPNARITIYRYRYALIGPFSATLVESRELPLQSAPPPAPIDGFGFVADVLTLPCGTSVLTDPLLGALWACGPRFDDCQLAMVDSDFTPAPAPTLDGVGRATGGGTRPYELQLTVGLSPGVVGAAYLAATDEVCVGRTAQAGGIWCVDHAVLLDTSASPYTKAKRAVVPPQVGLSDGGHGLASHGASPWLYWVRSYSDAAGGGVNAVRRVNVRTLEVQLVAASNDLLDFSTGIAVLPPRGPAVDLVVPMGQEENNAALNAVLGGIDSFVAPTLIAEISTTE